MSVVHPHSHLTLLPGLEQLFQSIIWENDPPMLKVICLLDSSLSIYIPSTYLFDILYLGDTYLFHLIYILFFSSRTLLRIWWILWPRIRIRRIPRLWWIRLWPILWLKSFLKIKSLEFKKKTIDNLAFPLLCTKIDYICIFCIRKTVELPIKGISKLPPPLTLSYSNPSIDKLIKIRVSI